MILLVCAQVSAFIPRSFMQSARSVMNRETSQRKSFPPTCAFLTVGDSVVAEVDDIVGSVSEPMVTFLVRLHVVMVYEIYYHTNLSDPPSLLPFLLTS